MTIATLGHLKMHLNFTPDLGPEDDHLLESKLASAQSLIERQLGFKIEERFGGQDQDPIPPDLIEAVLQLAAWWYENRETAGDGARDMPWGVADIVVAHRDWSF